MKFIEKIDELVKLPFHEAQKEDPYITYNFYQCRRLLLGIDKVIIES